MSCLLMSSQSDHRTSQCYQTCHIAPNFHQVVITVMLIVTSCTSGISVQRKAKSNKVSSVKNDLGKAGI